MRSTANLWPILIDAGTVRVPPSKANSVPGGIGRAATAMLSAGRRWTANWLSGAAAIGAALGAGCGSDGFNLPQTGPAGNRTPAQGACPWVSADPECER